MNIPYIQDPEESDGFPNMVAFKWLMAGIGWRVDLPRLRSDKAYMEECLERALRSDSELLQKRGVEMLGLQRGLDAHCDAATAVRIST